MQVIRCVICLQPVWNNVIQLECGHLFHYGCLHNWLSRQNTCPTCRQRATINNVCLSGQHPMISELIDQALEAGHGEWDESVQYPVFDQSEIRIGDALDASERYAERNSTADGWPNNQARRSEPYRDPVPRPPLVVSVADLPPVVVGRPGAVPPSASLEVAPGTPPLASLEARALEYDLTSSESSGQQENDLFDTTPDLSESESLSPIIVRRQNFDLASSQSSSSPSTEEEVVNSHNDYLEAQRPGRQ